jgi:hypothetical protein
MNSRDCVSRVSLYGGPLDGQSVEVSAELPDSLDFHVPAYKWDGRMSTLAASTRTVLYVCRDGRYVF